MALNLVVTREVLEGILEPTIEALTTLCNNTLDLVRKMLNCFVRYFLISVVINRFMKRRDMQRNGNIPNMY